MQVLVRIGSEISIKSARVRTQFVRRLVRNIRVALETAGIDGTVSSEWSRIYVRSEDPTVVNVLQRVFGIESISPVDHVCEPTEDCLREVALRYAPLVKDKSFAVRVKRAGLEGRTSVQWEALLGGLLRPHARCVSLKNPEQIIEFELRADCAYAFTQKIPCPGGLPVGSEGRALCMLSGGIDSAVAAWLMMKRGIALDFVFFNLAGAAYERSVLTVAKALASMWSHGYNPKIYVVPFGELGESIKAHVKPSFAQVVLKRFMYRAGAHVAERSKNMGMVTGEAMGQVSSQTLPNLAAISAATPMIIMRPLIGYNKEEIINAARHIGTLTITQHIKEYCALVLKRPVTATTAEKAAHHEAAVPEDVFEKALISGKRLSAKALTNEDLLAEYLFVSEIPRGAVIVDCRSRAHYQAWHYPGAIHHDADWLAINFRQLSKDEKYVFYCPYGLESAVIAEKMQTAGYEAYSVRGGTAGLKKK